MIVKNEETNLPTCLESVCGVFDEIVVLDTGSNDRRVEIARSFGAQVFDFVWVDDFGAARNAVLARATGDYVFWLDADDLIEASERVKLEELIGRCAETLPARGARKRGQAPASMAGASPLLLPLLSYGARAIQGLTGRGVTRSLITSGFSR